MHGDCTCGAPSRPYSRACRTRTRAHAALVCTPHVALARTPHSRSALVRTLRSCACHTRRRGHGAYAAPISYLVMHAHSECAPPSQGSKRLSPGRRMRHAPRARRCKSSSPLTCAAPLWVYAPPPAASPTWPPRCYPSCSARRRLSPSSSSSARSRCRSPVAACRRRVAALSAEHRPTAQYAAGARPRSDGRPHGATYTMG